MAGKEVYLHEAFYTKPLCLKEDGVRQDSFGDIIRKENVLKSSTVWIPRDWSFLRMKVPEFPSDKVLPRIKEVDLLLYLYREYRKM